LGVKCYGDGTWTIATTAAAVGGSEYLVIAHSGPGSVVGTPIDPLTSILLANADANGITLTAKATTVALDQWGHVARAFDSTADHAVTLEGDGTWVKVQTTGTTAATVSHIGPDSAGATAHDIVADFFSDFASGVLTFSIKTNEIKTDDKGHLVFTGGTATRSQDIDFPTILGSLLKFRFNDSGSHKLEVSVDGGTTWTTILTAVEASPVTNVDFSGGQMRQTTTPTWAFSTDTANSPANIIATSPC
jgi:hypothetical protein